MQKLRLRSLVLFVSSALLVALAGCGSNSSNNGGGGTTNNPVPTITSLSPSSTTAGSAAQTLTITGTNFLTSTTATFNSTSKTVTYVSATQITIPLTAADQATAGAFVVSVTNPAPGGGTASTSGAGDFTVNNPSPTVSSISPSSVPVGSGATTVTITGTGFVSTSSVTVNGTALASSAVTVTSATSISAVVPAADLSTAGSLAIVVSNPAPGGGSSGSVTLSVTSGPKVAGSVFKSNVAAATVTAYAVNADGTSGTNLGSGTTDANGNFSFNLTAMPSGPVRLTATGGTYTSESTSSSVTSTSGISAVFDSITGDTSGIAITPITEFVNSMASGTLALGKFSTFTAAHANATKVLGAFYGITAGTALETLAPAYDKTSITSAPDAFKVGLALGTLTWQGNNLVSTSPDDLIAAMSSDISDGVWDGKNNGTQVVITGTHPVKGNGTTISINLPFTTGTIDFVNALNTYVGLSTGTILDTNGITPTDVNPLVTVIVSGVVTSPATPPAAAANASSSGAITSLSLSGHQYVVVAARSAGVAIVDVTDPTNPSPPVKVWTTLVTNAKGSGGFGGSPVGGAIVVSGGPAGHSQVFAFAYGVPHWLLLNATTLVSGTPGTDNPVDAEGDLPLISTTPEGFSGGSAYIAGGVPNGAALFLDTVDGYGTFNLTGNTWTLQYPAGDDPMGATTAENMGADIADNIVAGGDYAGFRLIDLAKGQSYYLNDLNPSGAFTALFSNGSDTDANSVDSGYHVVILTQEDRNYFYLLNLLDATENTVTPATTPSSNTLTVTPAGAVTFTSCTTCTDTYPTLSGSAVDSTTHLGGVMAGYSTSYTVIQLQNPATVPTGTAWAGISNWMNWDLSSSTSLGGYCYATDPHADGVIFNNTTGKAYGYVLNSCDSAVTGGIGLIQVDLAGFLAVTPKGTTGDDLHYPSVDPATVTGVMVQFGLPAAYPPPRIPLGQQKPQHHTAR
jgi:hypothetical protein